MPAGVLPSRLSDYCRGLFLALPSRKSVKKAIKAGRMLVDGEPGSTGTLVRPGMCLQLREPSPTGHRSYPLELDLCFEDEHLAIVYKPAGIPVSGNRFRTLARALPTNLTPSLQVDRLALPQPVHRLDAPTAGLLLVAKTSRAAIGLGQALVEGGIQKEYQAIVCGKMESQGEINTPIDRKEAYTRFTTLTASPSLKNQFLSHLKLFPRTGRTHQLRIHLSGIGHPIMGDAQYGIPGQIYKGKGLFLAATGLSFTHPVTREDIAIQIPPPNKFLRLLEREQSMWARFQRGKKSAP